LRSISV